MSFHHATGGRQDLGDGQFFGTSSIGGQDRNYIARIDPVTGLADSFDPNPDDIMFSIAVQTDGKIVAGGGFTTLTPNDKALVVTRNGVARLETDGGVDQTLNLNAAGLSVNAIAVQPDGKTLIGGNFDTVLGAVRSNIARLNPDGTLDQEFVPDADDTVYSIAVQKDGQVLVGGTFTNVGGAARNNIARLDATTGVADSWNPNANLIVYSLGVQADGKILAGGDFTTIGGQTRNRIARLDATTAWPILEPEREHYLLSLQSGCRRTAKY